MTEQPRIDVKDKKSPLKAQPLRDPGESGMERLYDEVYGKIVTWVGISIVMLVMAALEWWRWWRKAPPEPLVATAVAVAFCGFAAWKLWRTWPSLKNIGLGRAGEKYVGQWLEKELRPRGYQIVNDIPGDGHNIDHVLVGPTGIYAIETKTVRKPARGRANVVSDDEIVTVHGLEPDRNPIVQAKAAAGELARIVRETTGREMFVRPVVLYPGWYVQQPPKPKVWVLNEIRLLGFLKHEEVVLTADEVNLIASGIAMHVRGEMRKQ